MWLRWSVANRCRADAPVTRLLSQPRENQASVQADIFCLTITLNNSLFYRDAASNKGSLPCWTVPLYCHCPPPHCCWWMSFVVISHDSTLDGGNAKSEVSDEARYLHKTPSHSWAYAYARACARATHKNAARQDNKAGKLELSMYALTAPHFLFAQTRSDRNGPLWAFWRFPSTQQHHTPLQTNITNL